MTCTSIFDSAAEARAIATGPVDLCACKACGLIFNRSFDPRRAEIGARYESSQAASAHFSAFARGLALDWIERHRLAGKRVIEVGCGQGDFLRLLLANGVAHAIGIDPLAGPRIPGDSNRLELHLRLFDEDALEIQADALVCRHTLEHVQDVHGFLARVARWARRDVGRVVLFELPATERVLAERAFWDVYYEHCNYFTAASLAHAFELAGLEVLRCERAYGDQYLLLEARSGAPKLRDTAFAESLLQACQAFGQDVARAVSHCDFGLEAMARGGGPIVLWQGAAKTVAFLAAVQRGGLVRCAVDLNDKRHGRFLPGTGLQVVSPAALGTLLPQHVVLMNPVYRDEVRAMLSSLGVGAKLSTIVDLCSLDGTASPSSLE